MQSKGYYVLLKELQAARAWMHRKRIQTDNTRFDKIYEDINLLCDRYSEGDIQKLSHEQIDSCLTSLLDADAYVTIHQAFSDLKDHKIPLRRIRESLHGPFKVNDEETSGSSIHGRDSLFELHFAARIKLRGIDLTGFDDISFVFQGVTFNVQCKRIHSLNRILKNFHDACRQVTARSKTDLERGLIAFSIEKILGTEKDGWGVPDERYLRDLAKEEMDSFVKAHYRSWYGSVDTRILGVIVNFEYKAVVKNLGDLLTKGYETVIVSLCQESSLQYKDVHLIQELGKIITDKSKQWQ